jgi:hypothetical protein
MTLEAYKISQLPTGSTPTGTEIIPVDQNGATVTLTVAQIAALAATGTTVDQLLTLLTGQITESQLYSELGSRIDLIDAASTTAGSVAARVKAETDARVSALSDEVTARETGDTNTLSTAQTYASTYVGNYAYNKVTVDNAIAQAGTDLTTAYQSADSATLASANNYTYSKSAIDSAVAASASTLTTNYQTYANGVGSTVLSNAESYVQTYAYSKTATDGALSSLSSTLTTAYQSYANGAANAAVVSAESYVNSYTYSTSTIDGAIASSATTLTTAINGVNSSLSTFAGTQATLNGQLEAQYYVKVDVDGYVSGFGLYSTAGNGTPSSEFIVRADRFAIAAPSSDGLSTSIPFIVQTTNTVINGITVSAGVYIDTAYIATLHGNKIETDSITTKSINGGAICQVYSTAYPGGTNEYVEFAYITPSTNSTIYNSFCQTSSYTTYCYGSRQINVVGFGGNFYTNSSTATSWSGTITYDVVVRRVVNGVATIIWSSQAIGEYGYLVAGTGNNVPITGKAITILDSDSLGSPGTAVSLYYDVAIRGVSAISNGTTPDLKLGLTFSATTYAGQRYISMVEYQK